MHLMHFDEIQAFKTRMNVAVIIIIINCNGFHVHRCIECIRELETAKDQGSSRLHTSQGRNPAMSSPRNSCIARANAYQPTWLQHEGAHVTDLMLGDDTRTYRRAAHGAIHKLNQSHANSPRPRYDKLITSCHFRTVSRRLASTSAPCNS